MEEAICARCGKTAPVDIINEGICIECGWLNEDSAHTKIGNNSQTAINTLRIINNVVAVLGGIFALVLLFVIPTRLIGVIAMASIAFVVLIAWAVNRLFIGIAEDIKGIREHLNK
jgi:hypothetical protein